MYNTQPERFLDRPTIERVEKVTKRMFNSTKKIPPNQKTYAFGDIHGMNKHLLKMLELISKEEYAFGCKLVFLGDYVDRGPGVAESIAIIRLLQEMLPGKVTALMGNHEQMLVNELSGHGRNNYGQATFDSFRLLGFNRIPDDVIDWIEELPYICEDENHYYVHAGFNPHRSIKDQFKDDCLWIRDVFLNSNHDFGKLVVHGHTPRDTIELNLVRCGIDTGACFDLEGNRYLTVAEFSGRRMPSGFYQVNFKNKYILKNDYLGNETEYKLVEKKK